MSGVVEAMRAGRPVFGGWTLTGHPAVAEIIAASGFDFLTVDLEHTDIALGDLHRCALAAKGEDCEVLARLPSCDAVMAKRALDLGAAGIIVPSVNSPEEAARSVAMALFPPEGVRGASLCRATGYGTRFGEYYGDHNRRAAVVVMLEHKDAARDAEAILATPGIAAALVGPYDLSASMGLAGQLDHPEVVAAQGAILGACRRRGVPAGIHVVSGDPAEIRRRVEEGYLFIACGIDTLFLREGCRRALAWKVV
ncbi:MAG: 2,4-dihydroxyhept-2-ene-1,7-dioic acid aldolase [Verrucomicrobiae bacterium]|nr:2,4-dihydroxyhept-2-ene-1,7-dioic acid aldolase [Verrucomicrobiae bacterium]